MMSDFLERLKGTIVSPAKTFDAIIEKRPSLVEPTMIFLAFGVAALLANIVAIMRILSIRFHPLMFLFSFLSPFIIVGISCLLIFLGLRSIEKFKRSRWRMDIKLLYTLLGFSAIPLLLFRLYYPVSVYIMNMLAERPSGAMLLLSKVPPVLFTVWFAYLLALSLNRHYSRDTSPQENMANTLLGGFLILGVFNLMHPSIHLSPQPLPLAAAILWLVLGAVSLAAWEKIGHHSRAKLVVIGVLGFVMLANSVLLYISVSTQDAQVAENLRTAEVEFKISVITNGDLNDVTVLVPLPRFKNQALNLSATDTFHELESPTYWDLSYFPLEPPSKEKPAHLRNVGKVVIKGSELEFVNEEEFIPLNERTRLPILKGEIIATQHGDYVNLSISDIHDSEIINIGFKFVVPREELKQVAFPTPTFLYGNFGNCQQVSGNEKCDLRVRSDIKVHLQMTPNAGRIFSIETVRGVFNETHHGWMETEIP